MSDVDFYRLLINNINNRLAYNLDENEQKWVIKNVRSINMQKFRGQQPKKILNIIASTIAQQASLNRQQIRANSYLDRQQNISHNGLPINEMPVYSYHDEREEMAMRKINPKYSKMNSINNTQQNYNTPTVSSYSAPIESFTSVRNGTSERKSFLDSDLPKAKGGDLLVDQVDMHEYQKYDLYHGAAPVTIGQNNIVYDSDVNQSKALKIDASLDIVNIFGLNNLTDIQDVFNPMSKTEKNYLVFDSKYRSTNTGGITSFQWTYVPTANMQTNGIVNSVGEIRNIVEMRLMQPVFPALDTLNPTSNRVSILIQELISQSYVASGTRNYHWITRVDASNSDFFVELQTEHYNDGRFAFREPITELTNLTFSFGDPLDVIEFPPDRAPVTFIIYGATTCLQTVEPHNLVVGSRVFMTNFTTADPTNPTDASVISYMNSPFGNLITSIPTSNTFYVDVNTTGITPDLTLSIECYFEMFRFIFAIEFTCLTDISKAIEDVKKTTTPLI